MSDNFDPYEGAEFYDMDDEELEFNEDPHGILKQSEEIYERLAKQYLDQGEDFLVAVQKEVTKMILDVFDDVFAENEDIKTHVANLRKEFFVDGAIDYDKAMDAVANIVLAIDDAGTTDETIMMMAAMLMEALECQKKYNVLEFK